MAIIQTLPYFSNQHKPVALILQIVRERYILINTNRNTANKPYLLPPKSSQSSFENRQRPCSFSSESTGFRYSPKPRIKSDLFFFISVSAYFFNLKSTLQKSVPPQKLISGIIELFSHWSSQKSRK